MAEKKQTFFTYKGYPLVRKGNMMYYGRMTDDYVAIINVLSSHPVKDLQVADKVKVQLSHTEIKEADKMIVKASERSGLYDALDVAYIWLERENNQA
jgi:hypothetical protein